jgi:hypothetical protein
MTMRGATELLKARISSVLLGVGAGDEAMEFLRDLVLLLTLHLNAKHL